MRRTMQKFTVVILSLLIPVSVSFAGVRQSRTVDSNRTNIGTNPYADMNDPDYTYVNPSYTEDSDAPSGNDSREDPLIAGGYYNDYSSWNSASAGLAYIPFGTILEMIPSSAVPVMVRSTRYYYESNYNIFAMQVFDGGATVYQIVPPPVGAIVTTLPPNCVSQYVNSRTLSICGNTYFEQVAGGYQIVR